MIRKKLKKLLSFNGISLIIGIVGGIFGLVSPFIDDWNVQIRLKWLLFIIFLFSILILVLTKLVLELSEDLKKELDGN